MTGKNFSTGLNELLQMMGNNFSTGLSGTNNIND